MSSLGARMLVNVLLFSIAVGLGVVIWLDPWRASPPVAEKLSAVDPKQVSKVRIERPNRAALELVREKSEWRLVAPLSVPANDFRVAALLGLAASPVHDAFRAEGNDLSVFGLSPPSATLWLDEQEFRFGDTEPLNGWRYVAHRGNVHLITDVYSHHLLATAPAFVDPAPIGSGARLVGFSLPGARIRLEKGRWRADPPVAGFSDDAGERLAEAWTSARAASVKRFDPDVDWRQTIHIDLDGEREPLRFRVAQLEHQLLIARPDWALQYHFPKRAGLRLLAVDAVPES